MSGETPVRRVRIEPLAPEHAAAAFAGLADDRLYRYIPVDPPGSIELLAAEFRRLGTGAPAGSGEVWLNWVVREVVSENLVGTVQMSIEADGYAHVAYVIFSAFQGRGYAMAAVRAAMDDVAVNHRVHRFVALIDTRNLASCAVVERLGFERTRTRRDADFFKNERSDEFVYERRLPQR